LQNKDIVFQKQLEDAKRMQNLIEEKQKAIDKLKIDLQNEANQKIEAQKVEFGN
jgi:transcription initiation factor IIF auxiliary subunit